MVKKKKNYQKLRKTKKLILIILILGVFIVSGIWFVNDKQIFLKPFSTPIPLERGIGLENYFTGEISPRVPYEGLKFLEIDVHNFEPFDGQLDETDYHDEEAVMDGFTFVASKGEDFEFIAREDSTSNPGSFIETELYGWGPTVIRKNTTIGWGVPATARYVYVVKGRDFYGPNYSAPGITPFDGSQYGRYRLEIIQRK